VSAGALYSVQKFSVCKIYTVFVGNLFHRLAHRKIPYAVFWKASKTSKTLISKRRTLGDQLGLLFERQGLKLTQIHHEIIESLINGTDRPAANGRTH